MPIDERKLKAILAEHDNDFKRQVSLLQEDFKSHVGLLIEETDRRIDLVQEGFQGVADTLAQLRAEVAGIRKELEEVRMHLFRKADLERLEKLEQRVAVLEKHVEG